MLTAHLLFWLSLPVLAAVLSCLAVWTVVLIRRRPLAPYQPRRPVPWRLPDLLVILLFYLAVQGAALWTAQAILGSEALQPQPVYNPDRDAAVHGVARLMAEGNVWIFALCLIAVMFVAPVVEEFFFRLLLQGWLEAGEVRRRKRLVTLRRYLPRGAGPILLSALLFARLHFRVAGPSLQQPFLVFLLISNVIAGLLAVVFAIAWLRRFVGATASDFGWDGRRLWADVRLGLWSFLAVAPPIYLLQYALIRLLPSYLAPDPFTLFFLALVLGFLYFRTHRLAPPVVLHAALNSASVFLWLTSLIAK